MAKDENPIREKTPAERAEEWMAAMREAMEKLAARDGGETVDEWLFEPGQTAQLEISPTYRRYTITSILAVLPTGTTSATLTLGDRTIPVQSTTWNPGPVAMPMGPRDKVRLDFLPAAGGVYLEVMGYAEPDRAEPSA